MIEPFPESALNEEAARMLLEEYDEYFARAKMFTKIHAAKAEEGGGATTSMKKRIRCWIRRMGTRCQNLGRKMAAAPKKGKRHLAEAKTRTSRKRRRWIRRRV